MKRKDFIQIIKLRSVWKIDKRKGNYELPNGDRLSSYITDLVESQMDVDKLGIRASGDLCLCISGNWNDATKQFDDYILMPAYEPNETCSFDDMEKRIKNLVFEIIQ